MYHVLDAAMLNIPGTFSEIAALAHKYGFGGIGIPIAQLESKAAAREAGTIARDLNLQWGLMPMTADFFHEELSSSAFDAAIEALKARAGFAQLAGVTRAYNHVWPSNSLRAFDENFEWHVRRLTVIQQVLADHGIRYGLEFLGPHELRVKHAHPFVHTIAGVLAIADAADGQAGFVFDTWHWFCGSRRWDDVYFAANNIHRMVCMHVDDGVPGVAPEAQRDLIRALPMSTGVVDSAAICRIFRNAQYDGPVCCEPIVPTIDRFAAQPAEQSVVEVADAVTKLPV